MIRRHYKAFVVIISLIVLTSCSSATREVKRTIPPVVAPPPVEDPYDVMEKNVPTLSKIYLGKGYKLGANPDKLVESDCSHLVCAIARNSLIGTNYEFKPYYFPSWKIYEYTYEIEKSETRPGDIIFFRDVQKKQNHLGLITQKKDDTIFFVQASSSSGVIERSTQSEGWLYYWRKRFDSFRRWKKEVFADKDSEKSNASTLIKPTQLSTNAISGN
ncbi:NlpC/P60 family protein [Candidatus Magnetominusculus dajiuhuensis]|uniref:NlpC/P60 family protein n=1 Tax=Candidatus Magnetominusculus dajiuhuensis TaxID=3137712 RepID=UPI003B438EAD